MQKISSKATIFYKQIFPVIWFGGLAAIALITVFAVPKDEVRFSGLLMPFLMIIFGYFVMKRHCFNLLDEVVDNNNSLTLINAGQQDTVNFVDIVNVGYASNKMSTITLNLRVPCKFGKDVTFVACGSSQSMKSALVSDLIARVDAARRANKNEDGTR